ncbi:hypothetical protein CXP39_02880 [Mesoplasma syrphidae]|uniref:Uncharacterized protein n=1 Tax=Mesoplasma syrphidae TaxID=225999 RepID=A0A2K9C2M4_9MOLU|nr:hypothetical protein [Mesoplasma syrphidae]AUF83729.1 hypothetical protein CXP39_02880 [Mesoplasma syrphidae]
MANVNEQKQSVEFEITEFEAAWENAPILENRSKDEYRLCYICKFSIEKKNFAEISKDEMAWTLDLINAKKPKLVNNNYIAVHKNCISKRFKQDSRRQLKYTWAYKWFYDDEYYNDK